jgi:hypothetical protein
LLFFACCPGSRRGNTEQVVTRWQHPVASKVALDMPHWAMPSVLPWHTAMAIEMANNVPLKDQFGIWQYKFSLQIKIIFIIAYLF